MSNATTVSDGRLRVALATLLPLVESDERTHRARVKHLGETLGLQYMARQAAAAADERAAALETARAAMALEPDAVADLCERFAMADAMLEMLETCRPEHARERLASALAAYRNGGESLIAYIKLHARRES